MQQNKIIGQVRGYTKSSYSLIQHFGNLLCESLPKYILGGMIIKEELIVVVQSEYLSEVLYYLRSHTNCQYKVLSDLTCVDLQGDTNARFAIIYNLLSVRYTSRLRIKVLIQENNLVPSATSVYNSANWLEREVYDMFGVIFSGNSDLRRILTDYGFEGHPLRKDFPLSGFVEVSYQDSLKRVVAKPIELSQEFRFFESGSAW
jgi:NADH dehydrogenase (ubiquinone) Fe-S protein 3